MTSSRWLGLGLVLALGCIGLGWWFAHTQGEREAQAAAARTAIVDRQRDSVLAITRDSLRRRSQDAIRDSLRAEQLGLRAAADSSRLLAIEGDAATAIASLATAQTAIDSLPIYRDQVTPALQLAVATLHTQLARVDSSRVAWHAAYLDELAAGAARERIHLEDSTLIASQRGTIAKLQAVPDLATSFWPKLGYAAETAAIGVVTVDACRDHPLSVGCLIGTAVTARRLLARH